MRKKQNVILPDTANLVITLCYCIHNYNSNIVTCIVPFPNDSTDSNTNTATRDNNPNARASATAALFYNHQQVKSRIML